MTDAPAADVGDQEQEEEGPSISAWEFIDEIPTRADVLALLETLPDRYGIRTVDYADYVQGLPSVKKVKVKQGNRKVEQAHDIVTLYMSVAGRIQMVNDIAIVNDWIVEFEPEPMTPTGIPGMLRMDDDRIVYREYCLGPETRVLTTDLLWQEIGTVVPGDTLVGFDEEITPKAQFRVARVEDVRVTAKPAVRLHTAYGPVTCSEDHLWLVKPSPTQRRRWVQAGDLMSGMKIVGYSRPWEMDRSHESGWVAGMLDGEGWIRSGGIGVAQNPGPVLMRLKSWFKENDFRFTEAPHGDCIRLSLLGGRAEMARLLGTVRPTRLLEGRGACWTGRTWGKVPTPLVDVFEVEPVGVSEVVAVQTDCRTFVAEGMLSHNCTIWSDFRWTNGTVEKVLVGRRSGTAWVPSSGGQQAAGSNPYEKVETSARGRAIAAWGIGVLPGSGVASLEEMLGAPQNRQALDRAAQQQSQPSADRMSRPDLLTAIKTEMEAVRQIRGHEPVDMLRSMVRYLGESFGVQAAVIDEATQEVIDVDWTRVKDGQLALTLNQLVTTKRRLVDAGSAV